MYKDQGGKKLVIQGLAVYLPPQPPTHEIQGSHLPKKQQKWQRTELPKFQAKDVKIWSGTEYEPLQWLDWDAVRREEIIKQTGHDPWDKDSKGKPRKMLNIESDLSYVDHKLNAFRKQELNRCKYGHWFMLCGEATYLPGIAYAYFNWWPIDIGYPDYRHYITEFSYVIEAVRQDPIRLGVILASMRGIGKTYFALCVIYILNIFKKQAYSGMQSKNDDSAEGMWRKFGLCIEGLPDFLVPINEFGKTVTKGKVSFKTPKAQHPNPHYDSWMRKAELKTTIDYMPATDRAYDGETLYVLLQDEIGKIEKPNSVVNRFNVTRDCVFRGNTKRGFILGFTTVGNMEKGGGDEFKKVYYNADLNNADSSGWTLNGCVKYFISALDATMYDEYGRSDRKASKQFHDERRAQIEKQCIETGDYTNLIAYCQNNPYTEEEAFMLGGKECIFNASILQTRNFVLSREDFNQTIKGDLEWIDENDWCKGVKFVENEMNGLWELDRLILEKPFTDYYNKNNLRKTGDRSYDYVLPNDKYFSAGFDPTSHKKVQNKSKASKPAMTVRTKFNYHWDERVCKAPVCHYLGRIESPKEQAIDCIKTCLFFGIQVLMEKNKNAVGDGFITEMGFGRILMPRPGIYDPDDWGITSGTGVIEQYTSLIKQDVIDNGSKYKILLIVNDLLEFDPDNTQKYDSAVSFGLSLIASTKPTEEIVGDVEISSLFKTFNHTSNYATLN